MDCSIVTMCWADSMDELCSRLAACQASIPSLVYEINYYRSL